MKSIHDRCIFTVCLVMNWRMTVSQIKHLQQTVAGIFICFPANVMWCDDKGTICLGLIVHSYCWNAPLQCMPHQTSVMVYSSASAFYCITPHSQLLPPSIVITVKGNNFVCDKLPQENNLMHLVGTRYLFPDYKVTVTRDCEHSVVSGVCWQSVWRGHFKKLLRMVNCAACPTTSFLLLLFIRGESCALVML